MNFNFSTINNKNEQLTLTSKTKNNFLLTNYDKMNSSNCIDITKKGSNMLMNATTCSSSLPPASSSSTSSTAASTTTSITTTTISNNTIPIKRNYSIKSASSKTNCDNNNTTSSSSKILSSSSSHNNNYTIGSNTKRSELSISKIKEYFKKQISDDGSTNSSCSNKTNSKFNTSTHNAKSSSNNNNNNRLIKKMISLDSHNKSNHDYKSIKTTASTSQNNDNSKNNNNNNSNNSTTSTNGSISLASSCDINSNSNNDLRAIDYNKKDNHNIKDDQDVEIEAIINGCLSLTSTSNNDNSVKNRVKQLNSSKSISNNISSKSYLNTTSNFLNKQKSGDLIFKQNSNNSNSILNKSSMPTNNTNSSTKNVTLFSNHNSNVKVNATTSTTANKLASHSTLRKKDSDLTVNLRSSIANNKNTSQNSLLFNGSTNTNIVKTRNVANRFSLSINSPTEISNSNIMSSLNESKQANKNNSSNNNNNSEANSKLVDQMASFIDELKDFIDDKLIDTTSQLESTNQHVAGLYKGLNYIINEINKFKYENFELKKELIFTRELYMKNNNTNIRCNHCLSNDNENIINNNNNSNDTNLIQHHSLVYYDNDSALRNVKGPVLLNNENWTHSSDLNYQSTVSQFEIDNSNNDKLNELIESKFKSSDLQTDSQNTDEDNDEEDEVDELVKNSKILNYYHASGVGNGDCSDFNSDLDSNNFYDDENTNLIINEQNEVIMHANDKSIQINENCVRKNDGQIDFINKILPKSSRILNSNSVNSSNQTNYLHKLKHRSSIAHPYNNILTDFDNQYIWDYTDNHNIINK